MGDEVSIQLQVAWGFWELIPIPLDRENGGGEEVRAWPNQNGHGLVRAWGEARLGWGVAR